MKDSDLSTTAARDAARIVWFKRYPAKQTLIAFLLALLATTAFSIDPAPVSSNAVLAIDPKASGMLYVCYEVLLSFAGQTDAVMLLALACLLTLPFRYVFFGRGDTWRICAPVSPIKRPGSEATSVGAQAIISTRKGPAKGWTESTA